MYYPNLYKILVPETHFDYVTTQYRVLTLGFLEKKKISRTVRVYFKIFIKIILLLGRGLRGLLLRRLLLNVRRITLRRPLHMRRRWHSVHYCLRVHWRRRRRHKRAPYTYQHHPVPFLVDTSFLLLCRDLLQMAYFFVPGKPPVDIAMFI